MLVVLAGKESNVRSTVSFLERRGFLVRLVSTLNEAVELFTKKQANMLLLSVNFAHPKVEMLPVLMYQSFEIDTILYADESDRKSSSRLNNAKTRHVLFGPVSGPVVMMKIRQIERERGLVSDDEADPQTRVSSTAVDDEIKIGGNKISGSDAIVLSGREANEKQAAVDQLMRALSEGEEDAASGDLMRSGDTYVAKGRRTGLNSAIEEVPLSPVPDEPISARARDLRCGIDRGLETAGGRRRLLSPNAFQRAQNRAEEANGAIIHVCLREAVTIVAGSLNPSLQRLSVHTSATLVYLQTPTLSCAFVVSVAYASRSPSEIFHRLATSFFALLRDRGIEFDDQQTHAIVIDNRKIVESAFEVSEFKLFSESVDLQLGVAIVEARNPIASLQPYEEDMLSIRIHDLPIDEPVTFDVFLHLKKNQKFLRYLKPGAKVSETQISRLARTHSNVLLEERSAEAYRRLYAAHAIQTVRSRGLNVRSSCGA